MALQNMQRKGNRSIKQSPCPDIGCGTAVWENSWQGLPFSGGPIFSPLLMIGESSGCSDSCVSLRTMYRCFTTQGINSINNNTEALGCFMSYKSPLSMLDHTPNHSSPQLQGRQSQLNFQMTGYISLFIRCFWWRLNRNLSTRLGCRPRWTWIVPHSKWGVAMPLFAPQEYLSWGLYLFFHNHFLLTLIRCEVYVYSPPEFTSL